MSILPHEAASLLIAHYLRHLTLATGRRWTSQNDRDMVLLSELLSVEEVADDTIPPFERSIVSDRVTEVFERPAYGDPQFERWRRMREEDAR